MFDSLQLVIQTENLKFNKNVMWKVFNGSKVHDFGSVSDLFRFTKLKGHISVWFKFHKYEMI